MQSISRYRTLKEIASGGSATVYLAEDLVLLRKIAIKKLHPHLVGHKESVERFEKEAVAIARLSHENIIKIFDVGHEGGNLFLAMEFVDGYTLAGILEANSPILPNLVVLDLFHQMGLGLAAAHNGGIFHRDLKPSNILVDKTGGVRIADFGIAFLGEKSAITRTGMFLGTPQYASPEQAEGKAVSGKSDVFSLGVMIYRCITGRMPFEGETAHNTLKAILEREPDRADWINPRILPGLPDLLEAMLRKNPSIRPTAAECVAAVEEICRRHHLELHRSQVTRFLTDPKSSPETEWLMLHKHFVKKAQAEFQAGNRDRAWKDLNQAKVYGPLSSSDKALFERVRGWRLSKNVFMGWAVGFVLAGASVMLVMHPSSYFVRPGISDLPPGPAMSSPPPGVLLSIPPPPRVGLPSTGPSLAVVALEPSKATLARKISPVHSPPPPERNDPASRLPGSLMVKTNPPYARLYLDGLDLGETPLAIPITVDPGSHVLLLEKAGCKPEEKRIEIVPGQSLDLRVVLSREEIAP